MIEDTVDARNMGRGLGANVDGFCVAGTQKRGGGSQ